MCAGAAVNAVERQSGRPGARQAYRREEARSRRPESRSDEGVMDLNELKVFLTVAAERSFSRAANKLYRTQPAVSQAIQRLEGDLGERWFDRSWNDGMLTEAGRLLEDYALRLLRLAEETESAVR